MLIVGRRVIPWILHRVAHTGSRELFRLAVLAIALGVAFGAAKLFGVSFALGAFFAGMILARIRTVSQRAAEKRCRCATRSRCCSSSPSACCSIPLIVMREPLPVLATAADHRARQVDRGLSDRAAVRLSRRRTALTISASLAQIGEFSFILAGLGVDPRAVAERGRDLVLAGAILSIMLNPVLVRDAGPLSRE